ncbi:MAG: tyrosine-type recombinase/integrase [Eubacteriales bacterium]
MYERNGHKLASITPKPNGTYLIRISCGTDAAGKPVTKSRVFKPSKPKLTYQKLNRELDAFIKEFEDKIAEFVVQGRPDRMRFAEFTAKYLEVKKPQLSPVTYTFYEQVIREMLIPMFGTLRLRDIRTYHIQQFIQYLATERPRGDGNEGHIAPATIKRYTTVMRSIMALAYKMEYIDEDAGISRRIEFPKAETPEVEAFNAEEASMILKAAESEPINIKLLVETSLFTGLRRGEIVGLKWEDIDLEKQTLSVRRSIYKPKASKAKEKPPKSTSSVRTMAIPARLCETLKEYKAHQDRHASFLSKHGRISVCVHRGGRLCHESSDTDQTVLEVPEAAWNPASETRNTAHIRDTALANGCDIKTVSARLGHSDIETTNIYLHALENVDRLAAGTFDRVFKTEK